MPYSKDPSRYPRHYHLAFLRAKDEAVSIRCDSVNEAISLHHKLNAYRVAAETAQLEGTLFFRDISISRRAHVLTLSNAAKALDQLFAETEPTDEELALYETAMEKANVESQETECTESGPDVPDARAREPAEAGEREVEEAVEPLSEFFEAARKTQITHTQRREED